MDLLSNSLLTTQLDLKTKIKYGDYTIQGLRR